MQMTICTPAIENAAEYVVDPVIAGSAVAALKRAGVSPGRYIETLLARVVELGKIDAYAPDPEFWVEQTRIAQAAEAALDGSFERAVELGEELQSCAINVYKRCRDDVSTALPAHKAVEVCLQREYASITELYEELHFLEAQLADLGCGKTARVVGMVTKALDEPLRQAWVAAGYSNEAFERSAAAELFDSTTARLMQGWGSSKSQLYRRLEGELSAVRLESVDAACKQIAEIRSKEDQQIPIDLLVREAARMDRQTGFLSHDCQPTGASQKSACHD